MTNRALHIPLLVGLWIARFGTFNISKKSPAMGVVRALGGRERYGVRTYMRVARVRALFRSSSRISSKFSFVLRILARVSSNCLIAIP